MRKLIIIALSILSILLLSSCTIGGSRTGMLNLDNDDRIANARLKQVLEAIKNKDSETLKSLFSKQALSDADDFDKSMEDLFDFFQGEVDSWEKPSGPTVFESNEHGRKTKQINSYYDVSTDKQKYFFLMRDYPVDTEHPDNVGLYLLLIVKSEDEEKIWDGEQKIIYDGKVKIPRVGVYLPIK